MRVTRAQVTANRAKLVGEASRLLRERGLDGATIPAITEAAGFSHGGFYNHFSSKSDLVAEACREVLRGGAARIDAALAAAPAGGALATYLQTYLSEPSRDAPGATCAIPSLAPDVFRADVTVQRGFADGLGAYLAALGRLFGEPSRETLLATLSIMTGAIALARAVRDADPDLSRQILEAARKSVLARVGGARDQMEGSEAPGGADTAGG